MKKYKGIELRKSTKLYRRLHPKSEITLINYGLHKLIHRKLNKLWRSSKSKCC